MTRILTGIAALMIVGAAALPIPASAAEHGISKVQSTELSSQRRWHHYRHWRRYGYWGPRYRYWGPRYRYGYYGYPYRYRHYGYYGYPYYHRYYHRPAIAFGIGPFGFGVF